VTQQGSAPEQSLYSFLDFTLDLATERLFRRGIEINLRPKSFQVLRCLVERQGRLITREELLQAVWGDVAVTDESITKCIADVRKALADESQEIVRTVPRRGFLFQADVRPGLKPQPTTTPYSTAQAEASFPLHSLHLQLSNRRKTLLLAGVVLMFVGSFTWLLLRGRLPNQPAFDAIAVLPFESLSADADQQFVADGFTEALITTLGQASPLRVIGRTSVSKYQKSKKAISEIAQELSVDVVIEGTVTQSGDRLRVTANLIQVSPEKHIWAHSYERSLQDVLILQNEIAEAISTAIRGKLLPSQRSRRGTSRQVNPEAQLAYWKALYYLNARRDPEAGAKGIAYAEQAVQIDPDYAPAHAALAKSYANQRYMNGSASLMARARTAAERAIALDEQLAEAHAALALILLGNNWDWAGAEREARRAVSLNSSDADAHNALALCLQAAGRVDEGLVEAKRARELDPFSFRIHRNVGRALYLARKYDEALLELRQTREMQTDAAAVDVWIVKSCLKKNQDDEAVAADLRVRANRSGLSPPTIDVLRAAYSNNGLRGYWTKLREFVLPAYRSSENYGPYLLAEINAYVGDKEEAFLWLEKAYDLRSTWMPWIRVDPSLDPLRSDPRFGALLKKMKLMP
jgi:TolB-like protein/DNA-binding winged helix-turn-helix (wHTH) protein/Flp pilus assembly protein TadD